jgi:hypothetical protein
MWSNDRFSSINTTMCSTLVRFSVPSGKSVPSSGVAVLGGASAAGVVLHDRAGRVGLGGGVDELAATLAVI